MSHIVQFKIKMKLKRLFRPKLVETEEMTIDIMYSILLIKYRFQQKNQLIVYL